MLAILTTHPIQYQVPLWQALAREGGIPFEVWCLTCNKDEMPVPLQQRELAKKVEINLDG